MSQNLKIELLEGGTLMYNGTEYAPLQPVEPEKPKSNVLYVLDISELKIDQMYFFVKDGRVVSQTWTGSIADFERFNNNNVFLTKENAQKQADRNQLLADIQRFADSNNEAEAIDWNASNEGKYYIFYNYLHNKWEMELDWTCRDLNKTYFSSETIASQALTKFRDRLDILLD